MTDTPSTTPTPAVPLAAIIQTTLRPVPTPADRVYGHTVLDVVEFCGADNTGKTDATAAIQKAIDTLPKMGGTVSVPAGDYLVDPVVKLKFRSNMRFLLDPKARLIAKPNDQAHYNILSIRGVTQVVVEGGGALVGDRGQHVFAPQKIASQNTHEWGHAIGLYGSSQITVRNITTQDCSGDGISVSASNVDGTAGDEPCDDIFIKDCVSTNNRRQGYSLGKCSNVVVQGGFVSGIGGDGGTKPGDGIDIEPEAGGAARNIFVDGVRVEHCSGNGVEANAWKSPIEDIQVTNCMIRFNLGGGLYLSGVHGFEQFGNTVTDNGITGSYIAPNCLGVHIAESTYGRNYNRGKPETKDRPDFTMVGVNKSIEADIYNRSIDPSNVIGRNYFV